MCGNYQVNSFSLSSLWLSFMSSCSQVGNYIQTLWNEIKPEEEDAEVSKHLKISSSALTMACHLCKLHQLLSPYIDLTFFQCPCHLNGGVEAATTLAGALLSLLLRLR